MVQSRRHASRWVGLLCVALLVTGCRPDVPVTATDPLNVVVIMLDTVRADRLTCYGNPNPITPNIDRIAAAGERFEHFYSSSPWTLPAHASLFTGQHPIRHRATQENLRLDAALPTMGELFGAAGYETFASSANPVVNRGNGLARGFDRFRETFRSSVRDELGRDGFHANRLALAAFLDERQTRRPFIAFLNFIEAHLPYDVTESQRARLTAGRWTAEEIDEAAGFTMKDHYLRTRVLDDRAFELLGDLYEAEIAQLDAAIGQVWDLLAERELLERTIVVVLADHGENLGENGHFAHVFSLSNALVRVPLIIRWPDGRRAGTIREDVAQMIDVLPTLIEAVGIPLERTLPGRDLDASPPEGPLFALSEYYFPRQVLSVFDEDELAEGGLHLRPFLRRMRVLQDGEVRYLWTSDEESELLTASAQPVNPDEPGIARELEAELASILDRHEGNPPLPPMPSPESVSSGFEATVADDELLDGLRALGYVE